ncbi:MAG: homoprotocatechuate degradation operon regulator HpaR [Pseudorhodobacter sp. PARRP1]|nr:MAG: homoprotocatechuate degradation operon regulator HpaR [Pseudorhodobacter sp. PARRP1]
MSDDTPLPRDTRHALPMALLRAREAVMTRFRPMLAAHDINEQQWRVIRVLGEVDRLDATEVAVRANILAPSLTRMIRAMTERGLIHRARDASDGRRVMLSIAPQGRALLQVVAPDSTAIYQQLEHDYGAARTAQLIDMLIALADLAEPRAERPADSN